MNSYNYIESFFKAILLQSKTIQGRFFVLPQNGVELNTDELKQVMNLTNGQPKFPICAMMPPRSEGVFGKMDEWERYSFNLFFLNTTFYNGVNEVANPSPYTGTSMRKVTQEWEDMKQSATDFMRVLQLVQKGNNDLSVNMLNNLFRLGQGRKYIDPVSFVSDHRLSGVRLRFEADIFTTCGIEDYVTGGVVVLPPSDESSFEAELIVVRSEVISILDTLGIDGGFIS